MSLAAIEGLPGDLVPVAIWPWILGALVLAGGMGFLLGAGASWLLSKARFKRALDNPHDLMPLVREQLQSAFEAASALKEHRQMVLSEEETADLSLRRDSLMETLNEVVELQQQVAAAIQGKKRTPRGEFASIPFEIDWQREPADEETKLPAAPALSENLNSLLELVTENERESGILFIKIDGFKKLAKSHGEDGRAVLLRKFAGVIIRAVRDEDVVCRYAEDTIAVLFPSLEEGIGPHLAHAVKKSLFNYQFRLNESGPSIIVNAHYGYSDCLPHENEDLVLNRAGNALEKSESKGCNQLHIHDGERLMHLAKTR